MKVEYLEQAWRRAATTDHAVSLVDDTSHTIFMVGRDGALTWWRQEQPVPDALYRKAGS